MEPLKQIVVTSRVEICIYFDIRASFLRFDSATWGDNVTHISFAVLPLSLSLFLVYTKRVNTGKNVDGNLESIIDE